VQGIHQQEFTHTHALHALANGQPTEQRHRPCFAARSVAARTHYGSPQPVVNPPLSCLQHHGRIWMDPDFQ